MSNAIGHVKATNQAATLYLRCQHLKYKQGFSLFI